LWWGWPAALTGGRRRRQAIIQLHARSPVDVRRLYRREPSRISKALGLFGSVGVRLKRMTGDERFGRLALDALSELDSDHTAGTEAWGYPWATQTRWSFYPAGAPNVVVTSFAAAALAEAADDLGRPQFAERAGKAAVWTLESLYLPAHGFFAYHRGSDVLIHNASLLGARLVHSLLPAEVAREPVRRAVERSLDAQARDGSWPYGHQMGFVDSFHTGYVLNCLCTLSELDPAIGDAVARGARYYADHFFGGDGSARLWPDKPYPIDAHAAGTALSTLSTLVRHGWAERDLLERVAARTTGDVVRGGHATHRRYRFGRTTVQYPRWCDAHVALGMADAATALG
jgi:hypothetical protein